MEFPTAASEQNNYRQPQLQSPAGGDSFTWRSEKMAGAVCGASPTYKSWSKVTYEGLRALENVHICCATSLLQ